MRVYVALIGLSFIASFGLTPLMRRLGLRVMGAAPLRDRDVHDRPIPKLGGVAMVAAVLLGLAAAAQFDFLSGAFSNPLPIAGIAAACSWCC